VGSRSTRARRHRGVLDSSSDERWTAVNRMALSRDRAQRTPRMAPPRRRRARSLALAASRPGRASIGQNARGRGTLDERNSTSSGRSRHIREVRPKSANHKNPAAF
jgi:hypothetical protein